MKDAVDQTREMWRDAERRRQRRQEILEQDRIFTLANGLSLVRLFFLPPLVLCLLMNRPLFDALAVGLLFLGALTDFLDGIVARRRNEVSQLGKIIDPVADKLFVGALGVTLVLLRGMPAWFVALFLARDVVILSISYLLFLNRDIVMSSNLLGKTTTAVLMLTLLLYVVHLQEIGIWFVYLGSAMVVASGLVYARSFIQLVRRLLAGHAGGKQAAADTEP